MTKDTFHARGKPRPFKKMVGNVYNTSYKVDESKRSLEAQNNIEILKSKFYLLRVQKCKMTMPPSGIWKIRYFVIL